MSELTFDDVAAALLSHEWKFAKTMPQSPHWYTLRKHWNHPIPFEAVVQFIRDNSYGVKFGRTTYRCMDINGQRYWSMGAPLSETILINRTHNERSDVPYDQVAPSYDAIWNTPEAKAEDAQVIAALDYRGGSVLDVGCGTGLLLDHIKPDHYLGIDPSMAMLDRLKARYDVPVLATDLEHFCAAGRMFDLVVGLYGSPSYVSAQALARIPRMLTPGGRYFLMFYKEGYKPVTDIKTGIDVEHHRHPRNVLPGTVMSEGNFFIIEGRLQP